MAAAVTTTAGTTTTVVTTIDSPATTSTVPIVYYFPLLFRVSTICQDGLIMADSEIELTSVNNQFDVSYGDRELCERGCRTANFNGFLNFAVAGTCGDSTQMRYQCPCQASSKDSISCVADSIRLTNGTNGFLEIFGYDGKRGQTGWFPLCFAPVNPSVALSQQLAIAQVVCRTLGLTYEDQYGLTLPLPNHYNSSTAFYFPYNVTCTGAEPTLRHCMRTVRIFGTTCTTGSGPLHVRCTQDGTDPNTVLYVDIPPKASDQVVIEHKFELFEPSVGRWTSVSELGWTPVESDRVCRQAGNGRLDLFGASRMFSCKQYYDYFKSRDIEARSGLYQIMIRGMLYPVPCDMDSEDPGWTLLFNNTFDRFWTRATAESVNVLNYTINTSYSNMGQADNIVKLFPGRMYDIRIDAYGKGMNSAGGVFRLLKSQSLLTDTVTPIPDEMVIHTGPKFLVDGDSGFTRQVPHFSPFLDGNSIYGMNNHALPASPYGNLIARNPRSTLQKYSFWVPSVPALPPFISMWVREVTEDKTLTECADNRFLFETHEFNRRQIFASSCQVGYEPWKSHLGGAGWVSADKQAQEWIMVDLLRVHLLRRMAIAGVVTPAKEAFWVTKFSVEARSRWSEKWREVTPGAFIGNTDATTVVEVELQPPLGLTARFIRIGPIGFNGHIGLRWTVYGCVKSAIYPAEYLLSHRRTYSYLASKHSKYLKAKDKTVLSQTESAFFQRTDLDLVKVEMGLQRPTLITGLIFAGNPYVPSVVESIVAYTSAEGSRGNLKLVNGTFRGERATTMFSMESMNEPIYITVDRFGARMIRLLFKEARAFRFEIVGLITPDWCNLPLVLENAGFVLSVSTVNRNITFYGISQLFIQSKLTETGYGAWAPAVGDASPWVKADLKDLYTITAVAIGGQDARIDWASINISYAMTAEEWTFHSDIAAALMSGKFEGDDGTTVVMNPPITQARYVMLSLTTMGLSDRDIASLKFQLFGCKVPPSRSESLPGVNVLRGTKLKFTGNESMTIQQSLRSSYIANWKITENKTINGFCYNSRTGISTSVPLPTDPETLGYTRDETVDLYWPNTDNITAWGVRPIVSSVKCDGAQQSMDQCKWRHAHDDPDSPSSPIVPDCVTYCGDPGRISQTRKTGTNFTYMSGLPVTYECLYDVPTASLTMYMTCSVDGQWVINADSGERCPMYADTELSTNNLAENRPLTLSSVDVTASWLAKSWSDLSKLGKTKAGQLRYLPWPTRWDIGRLKCQSTKRETHPYVMLDLIGPVEVQAVRIDFGIGEDLKYANIDILVTNTRNPSLALKDVCYNQDLGEGRGERLYRYDGWVYFKCQRDLIGRYLFITFRGSDPTSLYICDIAVRGSTPSPYNNLAEFQKTDQSSTLEPPLSVRVYNARYHSFLAVDGSTATEFFDLAYLKFASEGPCSATMTGSTFQWWSVDLGQENAVYHYTIYTDPAWYSESDSLTIQVSNNAPPLKFEIATARATLTYYECASIINLASATNPIRGSCKTGMTPATLKPTVVYGRYVLLTLNSPTSKSALVLCEVRIFGRNCTEYLDRARFKPVHPSGEIMEASSGSFLVDGDYDTRYASSFSQAPYLTVDLTVPYLLDYVDITMGEIDMFNLTIATSVLTLDTEDFTDVLTGINTTPNQVLRVPLPTTTAYARYIRLTTKTTTSSAVSLQLRELRAISRACVGSPSSADKTMNYRNLAVNYNNRMVTSDPDPGSPESKVTVDGVKVSRSTMCFTTSVNATWQLQGLSDHDEDATVHRVSVYGSYRWSMSVEVSSVPNALPESRIMCGTLQLGEGLREKTIVCERADETIGKFVYLYPMGPENQKWTLCEVEVWGVVPAPTPPVRRVIVVPPDLDEDNANVDNLAAAVPVITMPITVAPTVTVPTVAPDPTVLVTTPSTVTIPVTGGPASASITGAPLVAKKKRDAESVIYPPVAPVSITLSVPVAMLATPPTDDVPIAVVRIFPGNSVVVVPVHDIP